jgi:hypothetical protein
VLLRGHANFIVMLPQVQIIYLVIILLIIALKLLYAKMELTEIGIQPIVNLIVLFQVIMLITQRKPVKLHVLPDSGKTTLECVLQHVQVKIIYYNLNTEIQLEDTVFLLVLEVIILIIKQIGNVFKNVLPPQQQLSV